MRIAYVCTDPGVPAFGCKGSSVHVQEVIRALRRAGAEVQLFARRFGGEVPADLASVGCIALDPAGSLEPAQREVALRRANRRLPDLLSEAGPFDLVYERHALWSATAMEWARDKGIPALLEVNAPLVAEQAAHRSLVDRVTAEQIVDAAYRAASGIIAVSNGVANHVRDRGVSEDRIAVVPNGVDPGRFMARRQNSGGPVTVGFVGTLKPWHGLETLIEGVRQAREWDVPLRLLIVGDGPERQSVEQDVTDCGLADVTEFTGAVRPSDIPAHLARIDIATAPYPNLPEFYFSPLKVVEYMAAGCAVVASRIGDIESMVVDGETGILCHPGNPTRIAQAILRLANDRPLMIRMGAAARAAVERTSSWDSVARRILALGRQRVPC